MSKVHQKCLIASAVTHGLLVVMLVVGSAFVPRKVPEEAPTFTLVDFPDFLIDEPNLVGGGNPKAGMPNPEPAPPALAPAPAPPRQPEAPAEKVIVPEPKPAEPEPNKFNLSEAVVKKAEPKPESAAKPEVTAKPDGRFDLSKAERKTIMPAPSAKAAPLQESSGPSAREAQLANAAGAALTRMQQGLSTGVGEIGVPGPGGAAYASYNLALRKIYEDAWIPPAAATDNEPIVEAEVTIGRDGSVLSARVTKKGQKPELDQSVQRTLNRVKKVPAFPSGSKDEQRTFKINFNLSTKLKFG